MSNVFTRVLDGLQNLVTSLGVTTRDPATQSRFVTRVLEQSELNHAYRNWIIRKCVDIPVNDAFRKDRYIATADGDADKLDAFYDLEKRLGVKAKFVTAAKLGRLYGGACVIIGTADPDWATPLRPNSLITHLVVAGRYDFNGITINDGDIKAPNYRKPESYKLGSVVIHHTRVIPFDGDELPYTDYTANGNWHGSIVQRLADAVQPAQETIQNCNTLINQASTDVFKTPNFMAKLASLGEESAMITRFQTAAMMRSNLNMMILDSAEEYLRVTTNLSGIPETMISFLQLVAGAEDIPFTRFMGDSASGLNATGAGDQRNYYDHIASDQNIIYAPKYEQIDPLLCFATWGATPEGFKSTFEPLWEMSENERATLELNNAQRDNIYLTAGVLTPDIIARQLQEDETYSIDEAYIKALESYEEPEPPAPVIVQAAPTVGAPLPVDTAAKEGEDKEDEKVIK